MVLTRLGQSHVRDCQLVNREGHSNALEEHVITHAHFMWSAEKAIEQPLQYHVTLTTIYNGLPGRPLKLNTVRDV